MYKFILENLDSVVEVLRTENKCGNSHFDTYLEIMNYSRWGDTKLHPAIREYWGMNSARLKDEYFTAFFDLLQSRDPCSSIDCVLQKLNSVSYSARGQMTEQFSFATKVMHMKNPRLPIFDSKIAAFFFFKDAATKAAKAIKRREFYNFLKDEYQRIIHDDLLGSAIRKLRKQLDSSSSITDEKIIDSLIWGFITFARNHSAKSPHFYL